ncbi:MAG: FtsX-like permease family protein, partial [Gemmatimonadales bacterium]|nr:FtsX-like permease family protein [Gemmatimonadales bacterium]
HIATMSYPLKMGATALMAFALVALIMACIGLYGAVSYAVAQRSREVGIRLSLGAARGSVVRLLLVGGLRLVAGGVLVGLGLAIIVGKLLEGLLFGVRGIDPVTLVVVPLVLILVTLLAAWVPARRAGRIDPVVALKSE